MRSAGLPRATHGCQCGGSQRAPRYNLRVPLRPAQGSSCSSFYWKPLALRAAWRTASARTARNFRSVPLLLLTKVTPAAILVSMPSTVTTTSPRLRLSELVHVQPGYLSRDRVLPAQDGTHRLLQAKDVSEADGVRLEAAIKFRPKGHPDLYQVSCGDILVTARGQNHRAYLVDQVPPNVLAAATFYILRANVNLVLPGYLAWWLNLPEVQSAIDTASGGTYISFIRRPALENLSVLVPALEVQHEIERVFGLWRERNALRARIDAKREAYIQAVCQQAVWGA